MISYIEHHGIKGQKWYVRRFQNEDGSLTSEGQKRYLKEQYKNEKKKVKKERAVNKLQARYENKIAKKVMKEERKINKIRYAGIDEYIIKKKVNQMSDAELANAINRLRNEKAYKELSEKPKKKYSISATNVMSNAWNKAVSPALMDAGRKYLSKYLEDKLGISSKSDLDSLRDESARLRYKVSIEQNKEKLKEYEDMYDEIKKAKHAK